jgi:hypothetical protein
MMRTPLCLILPSSIALLARLIIIDRMGMLTPKCGAASENESIKLLLKSSFEAMVATWLRMSE